MKKNNIFCLKDIGFIFAIKSNRYLRGSQDTKKLPVLLGILTFF